MDIIGLILKIMAYNIIVNRGGDVMFWNRKKGSDHLEELENKIDDLAYELDYKIDELEDKIGIIGDELEILNDTINLFLDSDIFK